MTDRDTITRQRIVLLNTIELSVALFRGPDAAAWEALATRGVPELTALADEAASPLVPDLASLGEALPAHGPWPALAQTLETEYVRLFVAGRGGVPAPLYASCHSGESGAVMGDAARSMRDRLQEAGLELALDSNEPPDHLAVEFEYLYHLLAREWRDGEPGEAVAFAGQTMEPWVSRLRAVLMTAEPHPVFAHAASLAVAVLAEISGEALSKSG